MRVARRDRPLRKVRHDSRTLPIKAEHRYGKGDDEYFKCWNCGFSCKVGRDSLGRSANVSYSIDYDVPYGTFVMMRSHFVAVKTDLDGNIESDDLKYSIEGTGCPFCHTQNWKGNN